MFVRPQAMTSKVVSEGSWELTTGGSFCVMNDDERMKLNLT
jgi:hypothetical protein